VCPPHNNLVFVHLTTTFCYSTLHQLVCPPELLLAKNERDLAAQAMHELGNLHFHAGSARAAYKWWTSALDLVFHAEDVLHGWRDMIKDVTDVSTEILARCGMWGCMLAGSLTSNIAQYVGWELCLVI